VGARKGKGKLGLTTWKGFGKKIVGWGGAEIQNSLMESASGKLGHNTRRQRRSEDTVAIRAAGKE